MTDSQRQDLQRIDWSQFETAYGKATEVPDQLSRLFSSDHADAMDASHELWCGLCHQHAYVSSAALPVLPFLFQALDSLTNPLVAEVLDILYGFAVCTDRGDLASWEKQLRMALLAEAPRFERLKNHSDEDVSEWACMICEVLGIMTKA